MSLKHLTQAVLCRQVGQIKLIILSNTFDPGISLGSANQCIREDECLRSNLSSKTPLMGNLSMNLRFTAASCLSHFSHRGHGSMLKFMHDRTSLGELLLNKLILPQSQSSIGLHSKTVKGMETYLHLQLQVQPAVQFASTDWQQQLFCL